MDETTEYSLSIHTVTYDSIEGTKQESNHTHYSKDYQHVCSEFNAMVVDEISRGYERNNARLVKLVQNVVFEYSTGNIGAGDTEEYFVRIRIANV